MKNLSELHDEQKSNLNVDYNSAMKFLEPLLLLGLISTLSWSVKDELHIVNIVMLHLIPILYGAMRFGHINAMGVSLLSIAILSYFFMHPLNSFSVHETRYLISFGMMIFIGQLVAWLSHRATLSKELETSERLQQTLIGSLSHELRTPLAAIKGASSGLLSHELNLSEKDKNDLYTTIDQGSDRMRRLIDNLLDTARIQSGMLKLKIAECDMSELLSSALSKTENSKIASLMIDPEISPIHGDAVLIELALHNLLDNAFKYGDSVKVTLSNHPEGVVIRICNTGSIPPIHEASMAWKPFSRLSNVRGEEGIGLGLYVAYRIANMHGGTIETMSDGVQFCVTMQLPLKGEG